MESRDNCFFKIRPALSSFVNDNVGIYNLVKDDVRHYVTPITGFCTYSFGRRGTFERESRNTAEILNPSAEILTGGWDIAFLPSSRALSPQGKAVKFELLFLPG